jgi:hypothetical protein
VKVHDPEMLLVRVSWALCERRPVNFTVGGSPRFHWALRVASAVMVASPPRRRASAERLHPFPPPKVLSRANDCSRSSVTFSRIFGFLAPGAGRFWSVEAPAGLVEMVKSPAGTASETFARLVRRCTVPSARVVFPTTFRRRPSGAF